MKTPRELLMERHQDAETRLDTRRREVVEQLRGARGIATAKSRDTGMASLAILFWRELIVYHRRIWTGLSAIWVVILAVNFSLRDPGPSGAAKVPAPALASFQEQQKLLNELLADRSGSLDVERPKTFSTRPRSERTVVLKL